MAYTRVNWDELTPINPTNLNNMDAGIKTNDDKLNALDTDGDNSVEQADNADTVDGKHAGNASGNVPISNGTVNTNLNADMVDGKHSNDIADTVSGTTSIDASSTKNITHNFGTTNLVVTLDESRRSFWYSTIGNIGYNFLDNNTLTIRNGYSTAKTVRYTITRIGG